MADNDPTVDIENVEIRHYVEANIDSLTDYVELTLSALESMPYADRDQITAAGTDYYTGLIKALVPDWDWEEIKSSIAASIWNVFCNLEHGSGIPDPDWEGFFSGEGVGRTAVKAAVIAAFAAIGASVGGAAGAIMAGAVGRFLEELITKFVSKLLDQVVRGGLLTYCSTVPV